MLAVIVTAVICAASAVALWLIFAVLPPWRERRRLTRHKRGWQPRADGEPLNEAETRGLAEVRRGWAMVPDAELARYERDLETYLAEMRGEQAT